MLRYIGFGLQCILEVQLFYVAIELTLLATLNVLCLVCVFDVCVCVCVLWLCMSVITV